MHRTLAGIILALGLTAVLILGVRAYQVRTIGQAGLTVANAEAVACSQTRANLASRIRTKLYDADPSAVDWSATFEAIEADAGAAPFLCPNCDRPYQLNPDAAVWQDDAPDVALVVCQGPHAGTSPAIFTSDADGAATQVADDAFPDWWDKRVSHTPTPE